MNVNYKLSSFRLIKITNSCHKHFHSRIKEQEYFHSLQYQGHLVPRVPSLPPAGEGGRERTLGTRFAVGLFLDPVRSGRLDQLVNGYTSVV